MSVLNSILEGLLRGVVGYKAKKTIDNDPKIQKLGKEIEQLEEDRDKLIEKMKVDRIVSIQIINDKVYDNANIVIGSINNNSIEFSEGYSVRIEQNKIYFYSAGENGTNDLISSVTLLGDGNVIECDSKKKIATLKQVNKFVSGNCSDPIKVAAFLTLTNNEE